MYTYPISINYVARVKAALMDKPDHGRKLVTRRAICARISAKRRRGLIAETLEST